jgi:hypothetical protein
MVAIYGPTPGCGRFARNEFDLVIDGSHLKLVCHQLVVKSTADTFDLYVDRRNAEGMHGVPVGSELNACASHRLANEDAWLTTLSCLYERLTFILGASAWKSSQRNSVSQVGTAVHDNMPSCAKLKHGMTSDGHSG